MEYQVHVEMWNGDEFEGTAKGNTASNAKAQYVAALIRTGQTPATYRDAAGMVTRNAIREATARRMDLSPA